MTFAHYWADERFAHKRPDLAGSRKLRFGDNIYQPDGAGGWHQVDSHHSLHDGSPNPLNVVADTGVDRVLVSSDFIYWGGDGPKIPGHLRDFGPEHKDVCCTTQGHKCQFPGGLVTAVGDWLDGSDDRGFCGRPGQWPAAG